MISSSRSCNSSVRGSAYARTRTNKASKSIHQTCLSPNVRRCTSISPLASSSSSSTSLEASKPLTILVLGGTGFVGTAFIKLARTKGHKVVSVSRRGRPPAGSPLSGYTDQGVEWVQGDATSLELLQSIVTSHPEINACFHCIGLLLDDASGLSQLNKFASGSGSVPASGASYDAITRQTAMNAMQALASAAVLKSGTTSRLPFAFTSAAEAGWEFKAPVDFLERYLIAKRAVEQSLMSQAHLRGTILRPSLIWTWERPAALLSVVPFTIAARLGIPFIEEPVQLETLVGAALVALQDEKEGGVKRHDEMQSLAKRLQ